MNNKFCFRFFDTKKRIKIGDLVYIDDGDESGVVEEILVPYSQDAFDSSEKQGGIVIKNYCTIICPRSCKFLQKNPNEGYFFNSLKIIKKGDTVFFGKNKKRGVVIQIYPAYSKDAYRIKKENTGEIVIKCDNEIISRSLITTRFYMNSINNDD